MIAGWFKNFTPSYNDFIKALLINDVKAMNHYMNKVALATFSSFDAGNMPSEAAEPERIKKYGFAFEGKKFLLRENRCKKTRQNPFFIHLISVRKSKSSGTFGKGRKNGFVSTKGKKA